MAIQQIAIGTPGAGGGDPAYTAFTKTNQNFTNQQHAASRMVGTGSGNLLEVGAFGFGQKTATPYNTAYGANPSLAPCSIMHQDNAIIFQLKGSTTTHAVQLTFPARLQNTVPYYFATDVNGVYKQMCVFRTSENTTIDGNGFIKNASPIVQLYADNIHLNEEAQLQDITFEKLGVGDYLVKGSLGFAKTGWYIEMPKDANGNVLVAVVYEQLENNDISVKTYAKKFDDETGDIVANLTKPRDIPAGRWIDLRLQELPQPEIQIP